MRRTNRPGLPASQPRRLYTSLATLLALALGYQSFERSYVFDGPGPLWHDTLAKNPEATLGYGYLVTAEINAGQPETARELCRRAIEKFRSIDARAGLRPWERREFGFVLIQLGRDAEAETQLLAAIEADPSLYEASANLGMIELRRGRLRAARSWFAKSLAAQPHYDLAHYGLGYVAEKEENWRQAEEFYLRAEAENPTAATYANALGNACINQRKVREAINWFEKAVELEPSEKNRRVLEQARHMQS